MNVIIKCSKCAAIVRSTRAHLWSGNDDSTLTVEIDGCAKCSYNLQTDSCGGNIKRGLNDVAHNYDHQNAEPFRWRDQADAHGGIKKENKMAMEKEKWSDISVELYREYIYPDGSVVRVNAPALLHISESSQGGHAHRIQVLNGPEKVAYYIKSGWNAIRWQVAGSEPLFKF